MLIPIANSEILIHILLETHKVRNCRSKVHIQDPAGKCIFFLFFLRKSWQILKLMEHGNLDTSSDNIGRCCLGPVQIDLCSSFTSKVESGVIFS